jgi:hypothetical protein
MGARGGTGEAGQMAVELAALLPVAVVVALVVYNLASFVVACAEFDRASQNAVVLLGVSPSGEQTEAGAAGQVRDAVADAVGREGRCEVEVSCEGVSPDATDGEFVVSPFLTRYTCRLSFRPWPGSFVLAGVAFDSPLVLRHERSLVVDRFRPGVVM